MSRDALLFRHFASDGSGTNGLNSTYGDYGGPNSAFNSPAPDASVSAPSDHQIPDVVPHRIDVDAPNATSRWDDLLL